MSLRTIATLAIAIVLGLIAIIVVNGYISSKRGAPLQGSATGPGSPVVVAAAPIGRGVVLQPPLLKVVNYPTGAAPVGAFTSISQLTGAKEVQRVALHDLSPDEPILPTTISAPGGRQNLASIITPGMEAVSIRSNDVAGVGGFILPGDRIDVLLTRTVTVPGAQQPTSVTQILAQNVKVLGVDQSADDTTDKPSVSRSVTVEVTPPQAQTITLGQTVGAVSLSLRHVSDPMLLTRRATTSGQLGYAGAAPVHRSSGGGGGVVHVTRGADTTNFTFGGATAPKQTQEGAPR